MNSSEPQISKLSQSSYWRNPRVFFVAFVVMSLIGYFAFDLGRFFTLESLQSQLGSLRLKVATQPVITRFLFLAIYILMAGASLPGATLLTLAGGALFGFIQGTLLVSVASTAGACLAFMTSRFVLREAIQERFGAKLRAVNQGFDRDGAFYLFSLRLVPAFPFFLVNILTALTPLRLRTFAWVSQLGMLPATMVYVAAGSQLGQLHSLRGILSPQLLVSFAALGLFPLLAKKLIELIKIHRREPGVNKPKKFDYNIVVIGGGAAGLVSAYIASAVKAKVALIEKHKMGGDCLYTGCVPSKAIIRTARFLAEAKRCRELGLESADVRFDFRAVMNRVQNVIKKIEPHDSSDRYTKLGVDCITGVARIRSPYEVEVDGRVLTAKNIIVATGARPNIPPIEGLVDMKPLTSDNIWDLRIQPPRLLVLGGGAIGCELAQSFARLGTQTTLLEKGPRILGREDEKVSATVQNAFVQDGMQVLVQHQAKRFVREGAKKIAVVEHQGREVRIEFDEVLVALGRKPSVEGFGLEQLGVKLGERGTISRDEFLRTSVPSIFVCGDVAGPYQFTHTAAHQAWYCAVNALFSPFWSFRADYSVIPWVTYTDPEIARVGLNEVEAKEQGIPYDVTEYGIDDLDRAIVDSVDHGFVKVLTAPGKDRILGVTIVGAHSGEYLAEFVTAMKYGLGLNKILGTIHAYPTLSEANKYAAGQWKRNHAPQSALKWLARFHSWRRG